MNCNFFICLFLAVSVVLGIVILVKLDKKENFESSYCNSWLQFRHTLDEKAFENGEESVGEILDKCNAKCTCRGKKCSDTNNPVLNPRSNYDLKSC
jgi:hypothetical protein